ncbi:hypothetical protein M407DRAFT_24633 [Tulasnella calospora MUT 4182]|uniref:Uncharacterized protein n=1 Tax=Tulasnella calospora MUT 4182 TaxID=1051891 RepID=A0A0C3QJ19_9AGAM|nr:hypothetical protein M407DRAFT_24633 [Tulasnella calospora MUT 4182]
MPFISRALLSWTLFLFLVVQGSDDDNVIQTLLPFLPLILGVVATTYLVQGIILPQPDTFPQAFSSGVNLANLKPSALVTTDPPASTLSTLSSGAIDRPQAVSNWPVDRSLGQLGFLAIAIAIAIVVHTIASDHRATPSYPFKPTISRLLNCFKALWRSAVRLVSATRHTDLTPPPLSPYGPRPRRSECGTTAADSTQALSQRLPALSRPTSGEYGLSNSPASQCNVNQLRPHLVQKPALLPSAEEKDADDDEETWADAEDHESIQEKAVTQGYAAFARPLIPSGNLNPNIELLQLHPGQGTVPFPSFADEDDQGHHHPAPHRPSSTRPRVPSSRARSSTRSSRRPRDIKIVRRLAFAPLPVILEEDEEKELRSCFKNPDRLRARTQEAPLRVFISPLVKVRDSPMMKWDMMARRAFKSKKEERKLRREYHAWAPLLVFDDEEPEQWILLKEDIKESKEQRKDRMRRNRKYRGPINLELQIVPTPVPMAELEPEPEPERELVPVPVSVSVPGIVLQDQDAIDEVKSRHEWGVELAPQGHWAVPVEAKRGTRLRRMLGKMNPIRAVKRIFKH